MGSVRSDPAPDIPAKGEALPGGIGGSVPQKTEKEEKAKKGEKTSQTQGKDQPGPDPLQPGDAAAHSGASAGPDGAGRPSGAPEGPPAHRLR